MSPATIVVRLKAGQTNNKILALAAYVAARLAKGAKYLALALALSCASAGAVAPQHLDGWVTEPGVDAPSYAVTEPIDSNVNVDTIALICGDSHAGRGIELDLYLSEPGPLLPNGADPSQLTDMPSVEVAIDDQIFPARLLFGDEFVIVTNAADDEGPFLSRRLLDAMQVGATMVLRFDLLREKAGEPKTRDALVVVDLVRGHAAIAAVRRCASTGAYQARR